MRFDRGGRASLFIRDWASERARFQLGRAFFTSRLPIRGRRGIVRVSADGAEAGLFVAGMNVVGLAFNSAGNMVVATNEAVYSLPLDIKGTLVK